MFCFVFFPTNKSKSSQHVKKPIAVHSDGMLLYFPHAVYQYPKTKARSCKQVSIIFILITCCHWINRGETGTLDICHVKAKHSQMTFNWQIVEDVALIDRLLGIYYCSVLCLIKETDREKERERESNEQSTEMTEN